MSFVKTVASMMRGCWGDRTTASTANIAAHLRCGNMLRYLQGTRYTKAYVMFIEVGLSSQTNGQPVIKAILSCNVHAL